MSCVKKALITFFATSLIVPSLVMSDNFSDMERIMNQTNSGVKAESSGESIDPHKKQLGVYDYQEVVYQRIVENEKNTLPIEDSKQDKKFATKNVEAKKARLAELSKQIRKDIARKKKNDYSNHLKPRFASGYCYVDNEIKVERLATYAYLECDFKKPVGHAVLAVSLVPDFYAKALVGTPLYIEKGNDRFPVISGVVLTRDKTSINLANLVNDRKIAKITTTGIYTATSIATKTAQAYLSMKEKSATTTDTNTIATPSGTTTISTTNTKQIGLDNYLIAGSVELVSSLSKAIGEAVINDLPYTFKIYKDRVLFADVELAPDDQIIGVRSVSKENTLVKQEPRFSLGDGVSEQEQPSQIEQRNNGMYSSKQRR